MNPQPAPEKEREQLRLEGWILHEFASLPSTNPIAGALPPWHAVRADIQTGGRGRTGRAWVSDAGGLWISATIPVPGPRHKWSVLPLAAGWAMVESLHRLGVTGLRLRWPNDVLLGRRKLAGLLVEQFRPETAVVGIGLNVFNQPHGLDPALDGHTVTLSELVSMQDRSLRDVASLVLRSLRTVQEILAMDGFPEIAQRINQQWDNERHVELTLNNQSGPIRGYFRSIDEEGRLAFTAADGTSQILDATQVALLRELD